MVFTKPTDQTKRLLVRVTIRRLRQSNLRGWGLGRASARLGRFLLTSSIWPLHLQFSRKTNLNILFKLSRKRPFVGTQTSIRKLTCNLAKFRFDRHVIISYSVFNRQRQAASYNVNSIIQSYIQSLPCSGS